MSSLEPSLPVGGASWPPARPAAVSHPGCLGLSVNSNRSRYSQSGRHELPGGFLLSQHTVHLLDTSGICGTPWIQTSFALTALGFFSRVTPTSVLPCLLTEVWEGQPPTVPSLDVARAAKKLKQGS